MRRTTFIFIAVIGVFALFVDFWPRLRLPGLDADGGSRLIETKLGLDLQGGLKVEYRVNPSGGKTPGISDIEIVRGIIEQRVNSTGVAEPVVVTSGTDRIVVELPGRHGHGDRPLPGRSDGAPRLRADPDDDDPPDGGPDAGSDHAQGPVQRRPARDRHGRV